MEYNITHAKGLIGFDCMVVPINLSKLTKSAKNRSFSNLTNCCGDLVKQKKICSQCNKDVTGEDFLKKGYKVGKDLIKIDTALIKAIKERLDSNKIMVTEFRDMKEIPTIYYSELILAGQPVKKGDKSYCEYAQVLEKTSKIAIGTMIYNNRPYPVTIHPNQGTLMVRGLLYADEVKDVPSPGADTSKMNLEKVELMSKVLNMQKFDTYNHSKFKNIRAEEEEELIMAAAQGKELPEIESVPKVIKSEDNEEIAKLKKLLGE